MQLNECRQTNGWNFSQKFIFAIAVSTVDFTSKERQLWAATEFRVNLCIMQMDLAWVSNSWGKSNKANRIMAQSPVSDLNNAPINLEKSKWIKRSFRNRWNGFRDVLNVVERLKELKGSSKNVDENDNTWNSIDYFSLLSRPLINYSWGKITLSNPLHVCWSKKADTTITELWNSSVMICFFEGRF